MASEFAIALLKTRRQWSNAWSEHEANSEEGRVKRQKETRSCSHHLSCEIKPHLKAVLHWIFPSKYPLLFKQVYVNHSIPCKLDSSLTKVKSEES